MTKTILSFAGGFAVGLLLIWIWSIYSERALTTTEAPSTTTSPTDMEATANNQEDTSATGESSDETGFESLGQMTESSIIDVRGQGAGEIVTVAAVSLESDGWIVIHEERDGFIANALGAVRRDAGSYTNISIPLLRATTAQSRYWVVLYTDDGDRLFNLDTDFPVRNSQDDAVSRSFVAS